MKLDPANKRTCISPSSASPILLMKRSCTFAIPMSHQGSMVRCLLMAAVLTYDNAEEAAVQYQSVIDISIGCYTSSASPILLFIYILIAILTYDHAEESAVPSPHVDSCMDPVGECLCLCTQRVYDRSFSALGRLPAKSDPLSFALIMKYKVQVIHKKKICFLLLHSNPSFAFISLPQEIFILKTQVDQC